MLNEEMTQRALCCVIPYICHFRKGKATELEIKLVVATGWGRGRSLFLSGHKGTFWSNGNTLFFDMYPFIKTHRTVHQKYVNFNV